MRTNYFQDYAELDQILGPDISLKLEKFLTNHSFTGQGYLSYRKQKKLITEMKRDLKVWRKDLCSRTTCYNYQKRFRKHIYGVCTLLFAYVEDTCNFLFTLT
jgi:hypothetical protein